MTTLFITLACVGFLFLLFSAIFGGDHDVAHDADLGHGIDHGVTVHEGPSPFGVRVIAVFITTLGAGGAIASLAGVGVVGSTVLGTLSGLATGSLAFLLLKFSYAQQATSSVTAADMVGVIGQVKTAIPNTGVGQVSVVVKSQRFYPIARSRNGIQIEEGASVKVVQSMGDVVVVERVTS